jgi:hypothetical protein
MARAPRHEVETEDEVEQLVHGVKAITAALVGTILDTGPCNITQILFTGAPTSWEMPQFDPSTGLPTAAYFTLTDVVAGQPPRVLYSVHAGTNGAHSPHATHKMSGYSIPVSGNLTLQSCPAGSTWSLTTA